MMDTAKIIHAAEKLLTLTKRAAVSDDADARRQEVTHTFLALATELGKIASWYRPASWDQVQERVEKLHTEAVQADERRCGTFAHLGSETALVTSLHALSAVLGFTLADAATASFDEPEDEAARRYAEWHVQEAAE